VSERISAPPATVQMAALRARHRRRGHTDGGAGDPVEPLHVWQMLAHGAAAGAASEASTYPLDLVRHSDAEVANRDMRVWHGARQKMAIE
jgi:hypothetical protein